ncbi:MAG TPA: hypothetical protein VGD64_00365 [Acidisarcina sp.]
MNKTADRKVAGGVEEIRRLSLIAFTALLATLPLALRGTSCGHDFVFHIQSWLRAAADWRMGLFYPHWVAAANYGAGEPRLVFYPPASWMLGGLLGRVLPWAAVSVVFVLLALGSAGFAMYALAREWVDRDAAAMAACLYIANPYAVFVAYERTAYGELLGTVWMPLILLYALRKPRRSDAKLDLGASTPSRYSTTLHDSTESLIPLALCVCAVWLTNAPAAVMACYMLAVVAGIAAICERQSWSVLRAAGGGALGMGLAAFYIVPAAYERRWVDIGRAIGPGMRVEDSFLFGHTGEAFHDKVLLSASWITVAMIFSIVGAGFAAWRGRAFRWQAANPAENIVGEIEPRVVAYHVPPRVWVSVLLLPVLIVLSMFPVSDFVWRHAPELRFLQFPWRWLMVMGVCFAMLSGLALSGWLRMKRRQDAGRGSETRGRWGGRGVPIAALMVLAVCAALIGTLQRFYWQPCDAEDSVPGQIAVFDGVGFEGTDEYTTPGTDNSAVPKGMPLVRLLAGEHDDEADSSVEESPTWTPTYDLDESNDSEDSKGRGAPGNIQKSQEPQDLKDANNGKDGKDANDSKDDSDGDEKPKPYLLPAKLEVHNWDVESKSFTLQTARPGFAVMQLMDYPAWEVKVNGIASVARPHRNDGLMTVPVSAGVSTISVRYVVTSDVKWGRTISVAALVVLLLLVLRQRRNRNRP